MAKNELNLDPNDPENKEFFAKLRGETPEAEAETEGETEIVVGPEEKKEEEKPAVVTLTPEAFAELKAQADSSKAVKEGLEGLASKLGQTQAPQPVNTPTQTAEEFFSEHSDDIFDKEKGPALLKKFTKMVGEQEYGPLLQGLSTTLGATRKELLEARDPYFKKYKDEVEALVARQPANVRIQPNVYELAWAEVRKGHQTEIEKDVVEARVKDEVAKQLKALGIDPEKPGRPAAHVGGEGRSTPLVSTEQKKRQVRVPDQKTLDEIKRWALRMGYDLETALERKGYVK